VKRRPMGKISPSFLLQRGVTKGQRRAPLALCFYLMSLIVLLWACVLWGCALRTDAAQQAGIDADAILGHLGAVISWYHHLSDVDASAGSPSDVLYLENARTQGLQVMQLAFQSAEEEAVLVQGQSPAPAEATSEENTDQAKLAKATADVASRLEQDQKRIVTLDQALKTAGGARRRDLQSRRDALQGDLDLEKALQGVLAKFSGFMSRQKKTGLAGKIDELKLSVPELSSTSPAPKASPSQASKSSRASASGLIGQASVLLGQLGDARAVDALLSETAKLRETADKLQSPLRDSLRGLLQQGRDAVNQPAAAPGSGNTPEALEAVTTRFKQVSDAALPLRQEMILLDQVHANLLEWHKSIEREYGGVLRSLLTRVLLILAALAVVVLFSQIWRRATYRYVREVRRRRQLMLLRRFVTGFLMAVVVILGVVSEFSSLATFAGFLTAGIAVALQTVILSVAAYFFLIGRFGVRIGDRVTVSGVTGDVIDIGLVRMHLLELAGTGINLYPTGRVAMFSNSALFQSSPIFKQIPGTAYTWHEAVVALTPEADRTLAEKRLLEVVDRIYAHYRQDIERQHGTVERTLDTEMPMPGPQSHMRFTDTGLEFIARYPVDIRRASEIDDQVVKGLMEAIEAEPALKAGVSGPPRLRSVIRG